MQNLRDKFHLKFQLKIFKYELLHTYSLLIKKVQEINYSFLYTKIQYSIIPNIDHLNYQTWNININKNIDKNK